MNANNHPWIAEGLIAEEFEAVLVVTNSGLPAWNENSVMRAFQTYLWSHAPGGDKGRGTSFVHDDTGVIVCYEGTLVGIECGHGSLLDALSDLIQVLYSLGWTSADVYALQRHQQQVIDDIARKIPAAVNFDVRPGRMNTAQIDEEPEAVATAEYAAQLVLNSGVQTDFLDGRFKELTQAPASLEKPVSAAPATSIVLDDADAGDDGPLYVAPEFIAQANPQATKEALPDNLAAVGDEDIEAPRVFNMAANGDISARSTPLPKASPDRPHLVAVSQPQLTPRASSIANDNPVPAEPLIMSGYSVITVGAASIYFPCNDFTNDAKETATLNTLRTELGASNVHLLHVGQVDPEWRWQIDGEIHPDYPAFSDKLAQILYPDQDLALLSAAGNSIPQGHPLRRAAQAFGDRHHFLSPSGEQSRSFVIRELAATTKRSAFVVRVDALDGPFVEWVVTALARVARAYGESRWFKDQLEPAPVIDEPQPVSATPAPDVALLAGKMAELLATFQAAGIAVPVTPTAG